MTKKPDWQGLRDFIKSKKRLLITTHVHPDGDAIGSEIALAEYCRQCGCEVHILNNDPTPEFFQFVDALQEIKLFDADRHESLIKSLDGCLVVDISDWARLKHIGRLLQQFKVPVACVDHHIPTDVMGPVQISLEYASSAGEVLYRFFKNSRATLTPSMVNALYLCVLTDTGSFRYSSTTPYTLRMAADLRHKGADFKQIYEQVYENESRARTILKGRILADLHFECDGRLAYFVLTQSLLRETGAELWETEGFSELPRLIKGVEISIMFTETADHHVKVSFRSKGHIPVNGLAMKFHGGGHLYAAGATLTAPLAGTIEQVLAEARTLFDQ
jgi:bifunctional oligoribonuclease and PAP phosphatase NrnA